MTEDEAKAWIADNFDVSRETWERLNGYIALLLEESERQNLISASTRPSIWTRHILDSAQLLPLAPDPDGGEWIDLGAGAGLPAMVVAILSNWQVVMIDSRRKRVEFLSTIIHILGIDNASALLGRVELVKRDRPASVLSARAYAPLPQIFASAHQLAGRDSFWLLPKGKSWHSDLEAARTGWHGRFHVEPSVTDPDSAIVIARSVRQKGGK